MTLSLHQEAALARLRRGELLPGDLGELQLVAMGYGGKLLPADRRRAEVALQEHAAKERAREERAAGVAPRVGADGPGKDWLRQSGYTAAADAYGDDSPPDAA